MTDRFPRYGEGVPNPEANGGERPDPSQIHRTPSQRSHSHQSSHSRQPCQPRQNHRFQTHHGTDRAPLGHLAGNAGTGTP